MLYPDPEGSVTGLVREEHPDLVVPSGDDYTLLLDLRARVEKYLHAAADIWLKRSGTHHVGWTTLDRYDNQAVTLRFFADGDAYDRHEECHLDIDLCDILPEYAERRTILAALEGPQPSQTTSP